MDLIQGFVLAGGASVRMGACKALFRFDGKRPMVSVVADIVSTACSRVSIVVKQGQRTEAWPTGYTYLEESQGLPLHPLSGLVCGLNSLGGSGWAFFASCDVPYIDEQSVQRIVERALRTRRGAVAYDGHMEHPLLAMVPASDLNRASDCLERRDSVREFAANFERVLVERRAVKNINTAADVA